jgi:hypothetical protein
LAGATPSEENLKQVEKKGNSKLTEDERLNPSEVAHEKNAQRHRQLSCHGITG